MVRPASAGATLDPPVDPDVLPPHNLEAERAVLGAMLLDRDAAGVAVELLRAEDFYREAHQHIFAALKTLFDEDKQVDELVLRDTLLANGTLEQIGGPETIRELSGDVTSSALIESHARLVQEASARRQLIAATRAILRESYQPGISVRHLQDQAERRILELNEPRGQQAQSIAHQIDDTLDRLRVIMEEGHDPNALLPGYSDIDNLLGGFNPGEFIVLAARPSMGKTTLALNIMLRIVKNHEVPVLFVSLEMNVDQIVRNLLSIESKVSLHKSERGVFIDEEEWETIDEVAGYLKKYPIFIDDSSDLSVTRLRAVARRMKKRQGIGLVIVDYLQLMYEPGFRSDSHHLMISAISRGLKSLAKELKIPVLALSQLNRLADEAEWPLLSHLRDSGSIEQDADKIILLRRKPDDEDQTVEAVTNEPGTTISEKGAKTWVIVAKNRNGPTGKRVLCFIKESLRFESSYWDKNR